MVDVVVVGAGSAGCVLAGRLAERGDRSVCLVEAGPASTLPDVTSAASLAATAPDHPLNWAYSASLIRGRVVRVPRGRVVGGSSAINGAYFVRAVPQDFADWAVPGWGYADVEPYYSRTATDLDLGYGTGPLRVRRPAGRFLAPVTPAFLAACESLGHPAEPDKNAGGPPGWGLVPSNAAEGVRISTATAFLPAPWGAAVPPTSVPPGGSGPSTTHPRGLDVRVGVRALRVLFEGSRAVGVETTAGVVRADTVVLAAGAVGTPHLLLHSGIGPAAVLRTAGVPQRVELPVGQGWSDHPSVYLPFRWPGPPPDPDAVAGQAALNLDSGSDPAGDLEILLFARPFTPDGPVHLMCALQRPESRGDLTITSADPLAPPRLDYRYLRTEADRRRLRAAIRTAADVLRAAGLERDGPEGFVLGNDRRLDGWIQQVLTTSVHLCGSAALGRVVDPDLRVLGVDGLRVADTSVLPVAPRRGPAATAVMIGERAAALL
ncbi:GMC family oxidoreductase N-terminal domain-containing protein [Pseudonocardia pini]|uniref:GMC family oxidoreductase N-terminal domain-containing protein n=1 Tax=Pseudonocardia pini TaxID=2758030 RepID=UPI0015F078CF|nr:GMC family oxidoreductase N-terminal domain-containing protein [Pseudonocardia pini]